MIEPVRLFRASLAGAVLLLAVAANASAESPTPEGEPAETVEAFHAVLIEVMKGGDEMGFDGRTKRLGAEMPGLFDVPFMAQKSVGRYWKSASPEEREKLIATFERFMVSNYAGNFDAYTGETFETVATVESTHGTKLVRTLLNAPNEVVQLNYRLRPVDGKWRVIDVYLNGTVSELALRRSEYSSLIKREGFDSFLVTLDRKIGDLAANAPAEQGP